MKVHPVVDQARATARVTAGKAARRGRRFTARAARSLARRLDPPRRPAGGGAGSGTASAAPAGTPVAAPGPAPAAPAPNPSPEERLALRRRHALATAPERPRILEVGAAHHPVFPKREGFDTRIVDELDREGLVAKYAKYPQYDTSVIEDVDFVLVDGRGLADLIEDRFDLVFASHVLEHTTCMVTFLNDLAALLAPGGVLALVVPDHRYCFDRFRERSSLARVVETSFNPPSWHTPGTFAEFQLRATKHRGSPSWVADHRGDYSFVNQPSGAAVAMREAAKADHYVDVHNWVFSPHHLRLLIEELSELGLIPLRESHFGPTVGHEFFLNLSRDGDGPGLSRAELMTLADDERRVDRPTWEPAAPPAPPQSVGLEDAEELVRN